MSFARMFVCSGCLAVALSGCGGRDEGKLEVYKVTGEVFVNGEPATYAQVTFHPKVIDVDHLMRPSATVNEDGTFAASTYVQGDGLPNGQYDITVEWRPFNAISNSFSGPDKLGEKYAKPETSGLLVTIQDAPVEIPRMDLTPGEVKKSRGRKPPTGVLGQQR